MIAEKQWVHQAIKGRLGIDLPALTKSQNPIPIELNYYPSGINGQEKIRIK